MIVLWIALIIAVVYLFRDRIPYNTESQEENLEDLLKKRYVKGEISEETYLKMKKELKF